MKKVKVLYATTYDRNVNGGPEVFYEYVKKGFRGLLDASGAFEVEVIDIVFSKTRLLEKIEDGYNVIITDGTISSVDESGDLVKDGIGFSTIKGWLKDRNDLDVIIVEEAASKGKAKIGRLFKELGYYNICFKAEKIVWRDFMNEVVKLLVSPRTAKQALMEYGIEEYDDIKEYLRQNPWVLEGGKAPSEKVVSSNNNIEETASVVTEEVVESIADNIEKEGERAYTYMYGDSMAKDVVDDRKLDEVEIMSSKELSGFENSCNREEGVIEEFAEPDEAEGEVSANKEADMSLDEIEAMVAERERKFEDFSDTEVEESDSEIEEATEKCEEDEEFAFGDFSFNASETNGEVKGNVAEEVTGGFVVDFVEEVVKEESVKTVEERGTEKFSFEFGNAEPVRDTFSSNEVKDVYCEAGGVREVATISRGIGNCIMPAKGIIRGVVDYDTILVGFDNVMEGAEILNEYRCIVKVRSGMKGQVVNGRYKSANISFDAYLETLVDSRTAMMEVPEFDCEIKRDFLEGKECNFVFVKM